MKWVRGTVLVAVGLGFSMTVVAQDRGAVAIRRPGFKTPLEAAGTGLAPTVGLRLRVDPQGHVASVDVTSIRPASDYDAVFEKAVRETLERWRFAPALRDGHPAETMLEFSVQFETLEAREDDEARRTWAGLALEDHFRASLRSQILSLPLEVRLRMQRELMLKAEARLDKGRRRSAATDHFLVVTDAPDERVAQAIVGNLDVALGVTFDLLGGRVPPFPVQHKVAAYVFSSQASFDAFKRSVGATPFAAGFYDPSGFLAFHLQMPTDTSLLGIMLHEGVHSFVDRHLFRSGIARPSWLDEGLAEYIGNSDIRGGRLVPGRVKRFQIYLSPFGAFAGWGENYLSVEHVKAAVRERSAIPLTDLIAASQNEFYGVKRRLFYNQSWLLVHFLRHGRPGWAEEAFPKLLLYASEGYDMTAAFQRAYGARPADFEDAFRRYVGRM